MANKTLSTLARGFVELLRFAGCPYLSSLSVLPAATVYWVNEANGEPLLFVTAPANEGLLAMMDDELLSEIRKLAGEARRVTLIFDREGWSPRRFKKWRNAGFDVVTYRKGKYRD